MTEQEGIPPGLSRLVHAAADLGVVEQVDLRDPHAPQGLARPAVEALGRGIGVHDPTVAGVEQQHDRIVVFEDAAGTVAHVDGFGRGAGEIRATGQPRLSDRSGDALIPE